MGGVFLIERAYDRRIPQNGNCQYSCGQWSRYSKGTGAGIWRLYTHNNLHVQRMEVKVIDQLPDGSWTKQRWDIVEHAKTIAGDREVYLSSKAREIINLIQESNQKHGYKDDDFLFLNKDGRIHERSIDCRIRKYCRHIGIEEKGAHKTRKTYISTLIDAGVNINEIRKQVGHEDERTTYKNYCFNRMSRTETENLFEQALVN